MIEKQAVINIDVDKARQFKVYYKGHERIETGLHFQISHPLKEAIAFFIGQQIIF